MDYEYEAYLDATEARNTDELDEYYRDEYYASMCDDFMEMPEKF